jgi:hypothetical protein
VFAGIEPAVMAARGNLAVARGDFGTGLALLAPIETSRAPAAIRLGAARTAALGSWMGVVPIAVADSVLSRARTTLADVRGLDASELQWLDGVVGIAADDSARVFSAAAAITDTGTVARRLPSSLRALWNERRTQRVDRLVALEDSAMTLGGTFPPSALLHRLAIGRALTRAGDPVAAEHYLQWTDTRYIDARASSVLYTFGPYSSYQRALAFEAAGDKARAMLHFERFLDMVDRPPPSVKPQVNDAKARLARLAGDARR